jgi:TorA maturation chaperone TorD
MYETKDELVSMLKGRSAIYEFLSRAFLKPADSSFLKWSYEIEPILNSICLELDSERALKGANEFGRALASLSQAEEDNLLELQRQFTRLFRIGKNAVCLNESAYRSASRLLKQEPWAKVRAYYRSSGFQISEDIHELEDHAAVELAFMQCLTEKALTASDASEGGDASLAWLQKQIDFLEGHLNAWLPEALDKVVEIGVITNAPFYLGLSIITKEFLQYDEELLGAWTGRSMQSPLGGS